MQNEPNNDPGAGKNFSQGKSGNAPKASTTGAQPAKHVTMTRRSFLYGIGATCALCAVGGLSFSPAQAQVRPPGGQDEQQLLSACIRCQKCYEACPRGVIAPAHMENGVVAMRTPVMNFDNNWCNLCADENGGNPLCVQVCPSKALSLDQVPTHENTILGKAQIAFDECLAYRLTSCRFCYDACPYSAIELDDLNRPRVIEDRCNGCGACESVCVSLKEASVGSNIDTRAILVMPASV